MTKCICKKGYCDSDCLCNCHREAFPELVELNEGLDRIEKVVDECIENLEIDLLEIQINE